MTRSATIAGELAEWPSKTRMAAVLRGAGLRVTVGPYSVRVDDCSHVVFAEYGGDLGVPRLDADADTLDRLLHDARRVSAALARAGLVHRFELYDEHGAMAGYLHHEWSSEGT